jgi:hypothetical protein
LLAPLVGSDWDTSPAAGDFYFQASDGLVTLPAAGYDYDIDWTPMSAGLAPAGMAASFAALTLRPFLHGVYTVGIESNVILDRGDRAVGRLIGPDSVDRTLSPQGDAVVSAVTLVWAVRRVVGSLEQGGVHVLE